MKQLPKRLLSIDVLRALTMLLMIFVNDAGSVGHIPKWIDHAKANEDAMGFADTIFPAFLFIVGLSIPLAIKNRLSKGDTSLQLLFYIFTRSAALLIMGFYHVNLEDYAPGLWFPKAAWALIITVSFFLIWLDYPETMKKAWRYSLMGLGLALLIAMAIIYKGIDEGVTVGMHTSWWGILGIIGWSYLACALIYFLSKGRFVVLGVFMLLFIGVNVAIHIKLLVLNDPLPVIGDASAVTLVLGGVIISMIYAWLVAKEKTQWIWAIFSASGISLIGLGFLIRPYTEGISKIRATPAWVFICMGITILMFELFIYLIDIKGKKDWFKIIQPAGTSTLTCYLMPYFQVYLLELFNIEYPSVFNFGIIGLMRSMAIAFILIALVGLMEKRRLRLKI